MKIAIMGYSGSGKSTLARKLGEFYDIPVLHLDTVQFLPNWKEQNREEARTVVEKFMDSHDSWVIDGNYSNFSQVRRLDEADQIILLLFNRFYSLWRVCRRYRTYRGQSRPDMAEGCNEKLDAAFVRWILWEGRTRKRRRHFQDVARQYQEKTVVLRTQRQINRFETRIGIT